MQENLSDKSEVAKLIAQLPDDSTIEDMHYHLYVLDKIRRGQTDVVAGRVLTKTEIEAKLQKWL